MHLVQRYGPGSDYYVRVSVRGRRYMQSTGLNRIEEARRKAAQMIQQWKRREPVAKLRTESPTLAAVLAEFRRRTPMLRTRTRSDYENSLRLVVREGLGLPELEDAAVEERRVSVLTRQLARDFELRRLSSARPESVDAVRRSVADYLRQARGVFTRELLGDYEDLGLLHAREVEGFVGYRVKLPKGSKPGPNPPSDAEK